MSESIEENKAKFNRNHLMKVIFVYLVFLVISLVLVYKGMTEEWFNSKSQLDFHQQPAILFFNQTKGCECALAVYQAASAQIDNWPEESRHSVQVLRIDINKRPDLVKKYNVVRAPTIILVDFEGEIYYRQNEAVSDTNPIRLRLLEENILEVFDGH